MSTQLRGYNATGVARNAAALSKRSNEISIFHVGTYNLKKNLFPFVDSASIYLLKQVALDRKTQGGNLIGKLDLLDLFRILRKEDLDHMIVNIFKKFLKIYLNIIKYN